MKVSRLLWALATLWFCCGVGRTQDEQAYGQEVWQRFQPALAKLLTNSVARLEKVDGKDADSARHAIAIALAKNGDFLDAQNLAARLGNSGYAANAWATIGRMQGGRARDRAAANAAFAQAVEVTRRMKTGSFGQRSAYSEIAVSQAHSGDIESALNFVQGLDRQIQNEALSRLARVAAREGNEKPALALLQIATNEVEKSQAQSLRALAIAVREGDTLTAREALAQISKPLHKIPVLLALFDNPAGDARGDARLLDEALRAISDNKPEPLSFGFKELENDVSRGAIALRQLQVGTEPAMAIKQAVATLDTIQSPENALKYFERFCEKLAQEDLPAVTLVAQRLEGEQRIAVMSAIVRGLGRTLSTGHLQPDLRQSVEKIVNQALTTANSLDENERRWAGVPIAHALAEVGEFESAYQVANAIDTANQRAYAFAGIARSAMKKGRVSQVQEALKNLEAAVLTEKQPEVAAQIIGQTTLAIIEPLLGEESTDISSALVGLE